MFYILPDELMSNYRKISLSRVFAEVLNGKLYHYRDRSGLECAAVVHLRNGQYGFFIGEKSVAKIV